MVSSDLSLPTCPSLLNHNTWTSSRYLLHTECCKGKGEIVFYTDNNLYQPPFYSGHNDLGTGCPLPCPNNHRMFVIKLAGTFNSIHEGRGKFLRTVNNLDRVQILVTTAEGWSSSTQRDTTPRGNGFRSCKPTIHCTTQLSDVALQWGQIVTMFLVSDMESNIGHVQRHKFAREFPGGHWP